MTTFALFVFASGCSKDREDSDPCGKAIANAERLVRADRAALERYGDTPMTRERCRQVSDAAVSCAAYASSWRELQQCSPTLLRPTEELARQR